MKFTRIVLVLAAVAAAFFAGRRFSSKPAASGAAEGRKILYWVDPMHPAHKSDKPGIAPDCGMKLEPVYADGGAPAPASQRKILHYRDPKDPKYTSDKPGLNPETGNELEPVYEGDASAMPPGTVQINAERQQLIGVRYGSVEYAPSGETIRAVGRVAVDETRVSHVHSRTEGWIEKVYVNFTGDVVRKGQPMLTIYSPELLATQQEYLLAIRARDTMRHSTIEGVAADSDSLIAAARRRLELWDLSPSQIDEVARTGKPIANITLYAPASGYVISRNAFANQRVVPDAELYTVADLSRIWVLASVFEYQMPSIRAGQAATISLPYNGGAKYNARVSYVQPQVDPATRTIQVRLELANPRLALKPEMFVNVELQAPQADRLTVPAEAVMNTGLKQVVFVDRGNGYFEPREITAGEHTGDRVRVLEGLRAGERIVTSGNFLINSESQLKSAAEGMASPGPAAATAGAPAEGKTAAPAKGHQGAHQHD